MATLRERLAEEVPLVAVSFGDEDAARDAALARDLRVDVAELRVDWYASTQPEHALEQVRPFAGVPTLATIRSKDEGGYWAGDEPARLRLYEAVMPEVDAVDVELASAEIRPGVVAAARAHGTLVVLSHHDFAATPSAAALDSLVEEGFAAGADLVKISTMAHGPDDVRTLTELTLRHQHRGVIVIGMGAEGAASRVMLPVLGSRITYSAMGGRPAPGQLPFEETVRLLELFSPRFARRRSGD
ncbi:type I 3-dehydroquinate dehydratase [Dactylosporangium aurantiacum]|uniref:3-dehydroquinate dehydratase n=1 Tax=Dactylosporangium aurantiacum TaxID=35754 RepID=A0A9Q9IMW0_9ACTN|nr:type I 3-dehydroquinate dehydratase [Dactylosporangium aurantiacum]MDG6104640.1 type I 3-dehydroquinate dehydratase [Dactylosporangium aurantiacum]UWZ56239.1 type I 3-dehydroquinate dehydratase [Dactylosporangium aurantiacum]